MLRRMIGLSMVALTSLALFAQESLPPLVDGKVPQTVAELWNGYDPRKEPLAVETVKEWEQDGVVCRIICYQVGVFKGAPAKVAAFYAFPKSGTKLPALLSMHGGGRQTMEGGLPGHEPCATDLRLCQCGL